MKWGAGTWLLLSIGIVLLLISAWLFFTREQAGGFYYARISGRRWESAIDYKLPFFCGAFLLASLFLPGRVADRFNSNLLSAGIGWVLLMGLVYGIYLLVIFYKKQL
jgi:hypothetical protein